MGMTEHGLERKEEKGKRKKTAKGSRVSGFTFTFHLLPLTRFSEVLA